MQINSCMALPFICIPVSGFFCSRRHISLIWVPSLPPPSLTPADSRSFLSLRVFRLESTLAPFGGVFASSKRFLQRFSVLGVLTLYWPLSIPNRVYDRVYSRVALLNHLLSAVDPVPAPVTKVLLPCLTQATQIFEWKHRSCPYSKLFCFDFVAVPNVPPFSGFAVMIRRLTAFLFRRSSPPKLTPFHPLTPKIVC